MATKRAATAKRTSKRPTKKRTAKRKSRPKSEAPLEKLFPVSTRQTWLKDSESRQANYIQDARDAYIRRGMTLYLGAGVSRSIGLPAWNELLQRLTVTMMSRTRSADALEKLAAEDQAKAKVNLQEEVTGYEAARRPILMTSRAIKESLGPELPSEVALALYGRMAKFSTLFLRFLRRRSASE